MAPRAARGLRFPVLVKANIGGSGAGIERFDTRSITREGRRRGTIDLGIDNVALVQEQAPLTRRRTSRASKCSGGKFLYAINVYPDVGSFNLCPADVCQTTDGRGARARGMRDRRAEERDARRGRTAVQRRSSRRSRGSRARIGLDVGGIEYLVDDRDGKHYFYDINASRTSSPTRRTSSASIPSRGSPTTSRSARACRNSASWAPRDAIRLLAARVRRLAAQRRRRAAWKRAGSTRRRLAQRSEELGYDLTLDRRALSQRHQGNRRAVARRLVHRGGARGGDRAKLELMVAVRPTFHLPAIFAKQAANIDRISGGRLSLNVVSAGGRMRRGATACAFDEHDDRYARTDRVARRRRRRVARPSALAPGEVLHGRRDDRSSPSP